eukprot:917073-Pelagomonas_calceolata.AAC.1
MAISCRLKAGMHSNQEHFSISWKTDHSKTITCTINSNGHRPTDTIIRAELAAIFDIVAHVNTTEDPEHYYKLCLLEVKSCDGVLGNESADALALLAATMPDMADTSLNQAETPLFPCVLASHAN